MPSPRDMPRHRLVHEVRKTEAIHEIPPHTINLANYPAEYLSLFRFANSARLTDLVDTLQDNTPTFRRKLSKVTVLSAAQSRNAVQKNPDFGLRSAKDVKYAIHSAIGGNALQAFTATCTAPKVEKLPLAGGILFLTFGCPRLIKEQQIAADTLKRLSDATTVPYQWHGRVAVPLGETRDENHYVAFELSERLLPETLDLQFGPLDQLVPGIGRSPETDS